MTPEQRDRFPKIPLHILWWFGFYNWVRPSCKATNARGERCFRRRWHFRKHYTLAQGPFCKYYEEFE